MGTFKNKHQSASKVLKPAKLKQLREVVMKGESRPLKNRVKAKFEYENMTNNVKYADHFRAAREI